MRRIGIILLWILLMAMAAWSSLAIYYADLPQALRLAGIGLYAAAAAAILFLVHPRRRAVTVFLVLFAVVLTAWLRMPPSNQRNWQPDVAVLPYSTMQGDLITMHNIRNCDYHTETDYTVRYYDKTFDLSKLNGFDLFLSDWGLKTIVHTLVSFGFQDGSHLCVSIETRKEVGEEYSSLKGFFRQYELIYVVGDERDLVRLRTNYRKGETVYLYRLQGSSIEVVRRIFMDYLQYINRLKTQPEWYNALTGNCTTEIRGHTRPYVGKVSWDWRILANGYIDELAYEVGVLDRSLPFDVLKQTSIINTKALAADQDPAFSRRIREGLPGM